MKQVSYILSSILFILCLAACSDIAEDERYVYVGEADVKRAVLIEDFTGQRCVNCPLATDLIGTLQEQYGEENVIAVGIHTAPLGFAGTAAVPGLMNDESKAYGLSWGVETQPIGLVNRVGGLQDRADWSSTVYDEIQKSAPVGINLSLEYSAEDMTLDIATNVTALEDVDAKLQLWLIQDNIVALQLMPDGSQNREYVHNHVFRAAINGQWGEDINIDGGKIQQFNHKFVFNNDALPVGAPAYVPNDCAVVAFVYDNSGVLQVVKKHVSRE